MSITPHRFLQNLAELQNEFASKKFLLAVSGGADSMVLANLFQNSNLNFQVAHINYKLRGEDSDLDQKLIENFCKVKCHTYEVSEKDNKPENSIQLWARNLRYNFFFKILKEENLDFIVTAHHLNDELETFLINLSRGSGIKGLSGIPANENNIVRPLLHFSKEEIYAFAEENKIEFREDRSNAENDYLRNEFRNKIIPEIEKITPDFLDQFGKSISYLKDANTFIQNEIETKFQELLKNSNGENFTLDKKKLLSSPPFISSELIRKLGFTGDEIQKVISAENGKFFRSKTYEIQITAIDIICVKRQPK